MYSRVKRVSFFTQNLCSWILFEKHVCIKLLYILVLRGSYLESFPLLRTIFCWKISFIYLISVVNFDPVDSLLSMFHIDRRNLEFRSVFRSIFRLTIQIVTRYKVHWKPDRSLEYISTREYVWVWYT